MSSPEAMEEDSDPVVKEIPVFLSKKLDNKLFIFQYPLRPAGDGYDNSDFIKTAIKPENQEVTIEVAVDTNDSHYNTMRGQTIASHAEANLRKNPDEDEKVFDSELMDKIVLHSSRALPNCDNYGIGIYQDGEFHITPLKGILQLRPDFTYLEKGDKKKDDGKNTGDEGDEDDEPARQINVTFARQVPDFIKKMKEQSFLTRAKKSLEEPWIDCRYRRTNSSHADISRMEMVCSNNDDESVNNLNLSSKQYLDILAPPVKEEQFSKANIPSHTTSLSYIRTLPLLDQIRILMKDAKVMSFPQLRSLIPPEHETTSILKYLQQVAVLVQGNWVVNSELIYPKDTLSAHSGITADLMCRARDYVLLSFTEHDYVDRRAVSSVVKLPAEEIREIFTNVAKHQPKKGWKLIVNANKDFYKEHSDIAQRQELLWETKRKHLREQMEAMNQAPQRQRRKSNRESIGSENEERNVGRGRRKSFRDSSMSDNDSATEGVKHKKSNRGRKMSETGTS